VFSWDPRIEKALLVSKRLLEIEHEVKLFPSSEAKVLVNDPAFPESPAVAVPMYVDGNVPIFCNQNLLLSYYGEKLLEKVLTHECSHIRMWELEFPILAIDWGANPQESPFRTIRFNGQKLLKDFWPLDGNQIVVVSTTFGDVQTYIFGYDRLGPDYWRDLEIFDFKNARVVMQNPPPRYKFQIVTIIALLYAAARKYGNREITDTVEQSLTEYPDSLSRFASALLKTEISKDENYLRQSFLGLLEIGRDLHFETMIQ